MRIVKPNSSIMFDSNAVVLARLRAGLTQRELAEKLNVTSRSVQHWEYGTAFPTGPRLLGLAKVLGLSTSDLLYVDEEEAA
jgi:transcriptional regulator with XRE-family HTH domain